MILLISSGNCLAETKSEFDWLEDIEYQNGYYLFTEDQLLLIIELVIDLRDRLEELQTENILLRERIEVERQTTDELIAIKAEQINNLKELNQTLIMEMGPNLYLKLLLLIAGLSIGLLL